jgi:adenylate kinase family enzyme
MERILVIGSGGSGKTTVALKIAERLGLPLVHLDTLYWRPGWTPTPSQEWARVVAELVAQPRWVMDGNYGGTLDVRLAACDTVVFLDLPTRVCLWRVLKRAAHYRGRTRPDVAPGCPEKFTWEFVAWIWTYRNRRRPRILERLRHLVGRRVLILTSQGEVDRFIAGLPEPTNVHTP